ncbi:MAG: pyruvate kinase [Pirellulales bacterium]|nr:pyruvate kinase [Pirellulales bacterium]
MPQNLQPVGRPPSQTKIVATLGPASSEPAKLAELIAAGVDVFRINTAHGTREEHQAAVDKIREAGRQANCPIGILLDLAGPKIRLNALPGDSITCKTGDELTFVRGPSPSLPGHLTSTYESLIDELHPGDRVVLADGAVELRVENKTADSAACRVVQGGTFRSRQGINLPGVKLAAPALGEKDRDNARWAVSAGVDYLGLSFVRKPEDVRDLKTLLQSVGGTCRVVAKIEKPEALDALDAIVAAADGIMVARGDLGVEIDIAQVPLVQKRIVALCNRLRKPVIIATQMLESMHHSRLPTRAEVADVANAILDGADACMLSGETAVGEYPREAVEMMHRIAIATETLLRQRPCATAGSSSSAACASERSTAFPRPTPHAPRPKLQFGNPITEATTCAACRLAEEVGARLIVAASVSGESALVLSKHRSFVPILGVSDSDATLRRMCLYWGIIPHYGAPVGDSAKLLEYVAAKGRDSGYFAPGDRIVLVLGTGISASRHNAIVVHQVE